MPSVIIVFASFWYVLIGRQQTSNVWHVWCMVSIQFFGFLATVAKGEHKFRKILRFGLTTQNKIDTTNFLNSSLQIREQNTIFGMLIRNEKHNYQKFDRKLMGDENHTMLRKSHAMCWWLVLHRVFVSINDSISPNLPSRRWVMMTRTPTRRNSNRMKTSTLHSISSERTIARLGLLIPFYLVVLVLVDVRALLQLFVGVNCSPMFCLVCSRCPIPKWHYPDNSGPVTQLPSS